MTYTQSAVYLSRHETEFMGLPVGDPFGGAAYGKKEMPFLIAPAVTAAGTAIGAAAAAGTMAAIGTAIGTTVVAVGTIATVAGTAMTVVGAVTGDKDLMKIGAITGLAGGLAGMAAGGFMAMGAGGSFLDGIGTLGMSGAEMAANNALGGTLGTMSSAATNLSANISQSITTPMEQIATGAGTATQGLGGAVNNALTSGFSSVSGGVGAGVNGATGGLLSGGVGATSVGAGVGAGVLKSASAVLPTIDKIAPVAAGATAASEGGFFANLFSGMSTSDKLVLGTTAMSALKGLGSSDSDELARDKFEWEKSEKQRQVNNLNNVPKMSAWQFSKNDPNDTKASKKAGMLQ